MGNITKTYSIDEHLFQRFENICKNNKLNKSEVIQKCIKNFIIENIDFDNISKYKLKTDSNNNFITIDKKEAEFFHLSNGNIINIFDFEKMYEMIDLNVIKTLEFFENSKSALVEKLKSDKNDEKEKKEKYNESQENIESEETLKKFQESSSKSIIDALINKLNKNDRDDKDDIIVKKTRDDEIKDIKEKYNIKKKKIIHEIYPEYIEILNHKLKNLDKNAHDLTSIFNLQGLKIIRNSNSIYIYYDDKYIIDEENIKTIIKSFDEYLHVDNISFYKQEDSPTSQKIVIDILQKRKIDITAVEFQFELGLLIGDIFKTLCAVDKYDGFYYINLDPIYYQFVELYTVLYSLGLRGQFIFQYTVENPIKNNVESDVENNVEKS